MSFNEIELQERLSLGFLPNFLKYSFKHFSAASRTSFVEAPSINSCLSNELFPFSKSSIHSLHLPFFLSSSLPLCLFCSFSEYKIGCNFKSVPLHCSYFRHYLITRQGNKLVFNKF